MNRKNQVYLLVLGALILMAATFFTLGSKLVLVLAALAAFLFFWSSMLLMSQKAVRFRCLCLFVLIVLIFNGVSGILMHNNRLLTCSPQSRYYTVQNGYSNSIHDGIYFSFDTFTHLGSGELVPANRTSRAVALIISLTGYFGLAVLFVLLNRGVKKEE